MKRLLCNQDERMFASSHHGEGGLRIIEWGPGRGVRAVLYGTVYLDRQRK